MSVKYKSCMEIAEGLKDIVNEYEIDIFDWIYIDDFIYLNEYFEEEISPSQISIEWTTISSTAWVCSIAVNDEKNILHLLFKVYCDQESVGSYLN